MEYLTNEPAEGSGVRRILCCQCGVSIEPNPANTCVSCLRSQVDITEGIPKQATIHFCRGCERYLQPPADWVQCSLESRELLALCLKKLKGLNRVKLVDASFVWTEPHSKRIKVKLTVQGEVIGGAVLQQVFIVEYVVANFMCDDCHRVEAKDYWRALVQVRQRSENKKTFFYLEQLILKHKAHENTLRIKPNHEGLDFYYANESQARKMVDFITSVLPCRYQHSKKLLTHDVHSNIYTYKFTFSVDIVPISKDSVVCLSKNMSGFYGSISPLSVVRAVTNTIHLIDPNSAQIAEVNSHNYWRDPFFCIFNPKQFTEFVVMDVEPIMDKDRKYFPGQGPISNKHVLADIWVVKANELGVNESLIHTRSHLGHILKPGDSVLGYNLSESNVNNANFEKLDRDKVPDVILIKKHYGERRRKRNWKLKHLPNEEGSVTSANMDYNEFLNDLEEDPLYRQNVNIYKDPNMLAVDTDHMDENYGPRITLEEMLDDLHIQDTEMKEVYNGELQ